MKRVIAVLALVLAAPPSCVGGGSSAPRTPSPATGTAGFSPTVAPGADAAHPATPICPAGPVTPGRGDNVTVNADGDGVPDTVDTYVSVDDPARFDVQLTLDSRAALSVPAPARNVQVTPIGGYDVDGDGRDEIFVATGNGAYTTWVDVFEFDPTTCELVRLATPGSEPPQFAVGASVGNGVGLSCADGDLVYTRFSRTSDDPLRYGGTRVSYAIHGSTLEAIREVNVAFGADGAARAASFDCGTLRLPRP